VGIVRETEPVQMRWQEAPQAAGFAGRALFIQIPQLRPGAYLLELAVSAPGEAVLTSSQAIEVMK